MRIEFKSKNATEFSNKNVVEQATSLTLNTNKMDVLMNHYLNIIEHTFNYTVDRSKHCEYNRVWLAMT